MKRADGTAEMAPGGYDGVAARVAQLYRERLVATGEAPAISAPTNTDAHRIAEGVRAERRALGILGPELRVVRATDGERDYALRLARGDQVRLFSSTGHALATARAAPSVATASCLRSSTPMITASRCGPGPARWAPSAGATSGSSTAECNSPTAMP